MCCSRSGLKPALHHASTYSIRRLLPSARATWSRVERRTSSAWFFQTRDGDLFGLGAAGQVFLSYAGLFARLPQEHAHFELLIARHVVLRELCVGAFAALHVFGEVVFHCFVFQ